MAEPTLEIVDDERLPDRRVKVLVRVRKGGAWVWASRVETGGGTWLWETDAGEVLDAPQVTAWARVVPPKPVPKPKPAGEWVHVSDESRRPPKVGGGSIIVPTLSGDGQYSMAYIDSDGEWSRDIEWWLDGEPPKGKNDE